MGRINNIPSLAQIMAWRRPGDKPLPETMMVSLLTHICVTQPQLVSGDRLCRFFLVLLKSQKCDSLMCYSHWRNWIAIESSFWEVPHFYADTLSIMFVKVWAYGLVILSYSLSSLRSKKHLSMLFSFRFYWNFDHAGDMISVAQCKKRHNTIIKTMELHLFCDHTDAKISTGIILCMRLANERRFNVISLIGWVHTQNDPCINFTAKFSMQKKRRSTITDALAFHLFCR